MQTILLPGGGAGINDTRQQPGTPGPRSSSTLRFRPGRYPAACTVTARRYPAAFRCVRSTLLGPFAQHTRFDWGNLGVVLAWRAAGAFIAIRRFRWNRQSDATKRPDPASLRTPTQSGTSGKEKS